MFNKLRNRFLLMNMVIISLVMLVAFGTIYTITYRNVQHDIHADLMKAGDLVHKNDGPDGKQGGGGHPHEDRDMPGGPDQLRTVSFELQTDSSWNVTSTNSRFDVDSDFIAAALKHTAAHPSDFGQFTLDGARWAYSVKPIANGHSVIFMEVTDRHQILTNLIYTFAAVMLVMLVVIYLISRYFAGRSILPVQEAFEKQKRFIADASHELKTPLAVINTNADVLLANGEETISQQAKWLHHIKSETERMKTLTNDLLYLTEMDDARARMMQAPFDLSEAVEGVILTMEPVIFEKELAFDYEIEPGLTVTGSGEQMKQVTMILLDNALKYTNPKGAVKLSLKKQQGHIVLAVSNTGPGIPSEHIGKIFDRFYRADASRSRQNGGHGLGLAIAKSIVEQHRGRISARSVPDELTTFTVQLGLAHTHAKKQEMK